MINITDLMIEAERLHRRSFNERTPVSPARLAILTGAEIVKLESVRLLLPDAEAIVAIANDLNQYQTPGIILVDTGMATRDAVVLINTEENDVAGRCLIALALAHSAQEPARKPMPKATSRMVVISLPDAHIRNISGMDVFHAGNAMRLDPSGANIDFRPIAEAGINRLALSLLLTEEEIHNTAEWITTGSDNGREERMSAMLAMRSGVPVDWVEKSIRRHMTRTLKVDKKPKKTAI